MNNALKIKFKLKIIIGRWIFCRLSATAEKKNDRPKNIFREINGYLYTIMLRFFFVFLVVIFSNALFFVI